MGEDGAKVPTVSARDVLRDEATSLRELQRGPEIGEHLAAHGQRAAGVSQIGVFCRIAATNTRNFNGIAAMRSLSRRSASARSSALAIITL
jgi:hypothetical protein